MNELAIYESLLFVAGDDGLSLKEMAKLTNATTDHVLVSLDKLLNEYNSRNSSALTIIETANKYKLVTKEMYSTIVSGYAQSPLMQKLSKALLETLAIIAYKQPVTRMEIEEIRGV